MSDDLRVTWDAVSWNGDEGSYEILRSHDGSSYSQIASVSSGTTSYDDTGLLDGEEYSYKVRATNSEGSSTSSASSAITSLPSASNLSLTASSNSSLDVTWTNNSDNENGFKVYYRQIGTSTWNQFSDLGAGTTTDTITGLNGDTEYEVYIETYTEHTTSDSGTNNGTTYLNTNVSISSHISTINSELLGPELNTTSYVKPISNQIQTLISVSQKISSHSTHIKSNTKRIVELIRGNNFYASPINSVTGRSQVNYSPRSQTSSSGAISSFTYNERTSLELVDYSVEWDDDKAVWYTPWFHETRVLGDEDTLAIRSDVVESAKDPAAVIVVQYDEDEDGTVDAESDPIFVSDNEQAHTVEGVPVSEEGKYRIKIKEYSGYNSIYTLNLGIVH